MDIPISPEAKQVYANYTWLQKKYYATGDPDLLPLIKCCQVALRLPHIERCPHCAEIISQVDGEYNDLVDIPMWKHIVHCKGIH